MNGDGIGDQPPNVLETSDRLLRAATRPAMSTRRTGDTEVREWTSLAGFDAIDLGELLGMLHDAEAARLREEIRAAIDDRRSREPGSDERPEAVEPRRRGELGYADWCLRLIEAGHRSCDGCGGHLEGECDDEQQDHR